MKGKGGEEEWDRNVYTDISQLAAQGFPDLLWICKKKLKFQHSGHIQLQPFFPSQSYVEPKPEIAPNKNLSKQTKYVCDAPIYRWMRPILDLMCHHDTRLALELFANDGFEDVMPNMCIQGRQDIVHTNHLKGPPVEFVVGWLLKRVVYKPQGNNFFQSGRKKTAPLWKKSKSIMNCLKVFRDENGKVQQKTSLHKLRKHQQSPHINSVKTCTCLSYPKRTPISQNHLAKFTCAPLYTARAKETRCFWPPDNWTPSSPTNVSTFEGRESISWFWWETRNPAWEIQGIVEEDQEIPPDDSRCYHGKICLVLVNPVTNLPTRGVARHLLSFHCQWRKIRIDQESYQSKFEDS